MLWVQVPSTAYCNPIEQAILELSAHGLLLRELSNHGLAQLVYQTYQ